MDSMLGEPWMLSPSVALRAEPFGALAYHFGNRRLTFVKRLELVDVLNGLANADTVEEALEAAGIPAPQHRAYASALRGLAEADMIRRRSIDDVCVPSDIEGAIR